MITFSCISIIFALEPSLHCGSNCALACDYQSMYMLCAVNHYRCSSWLLMYDRSDRSLVSLLIVDVLV